MPSVKTSEPVDPGECSRKMGTTQCETHESHFVQDNFVCAAAELQRQERRIPTCKYHPGVPMILGYDNGGGEFFCPICESQSNQ